MDPLILVVEDDPVICDVVQRYLEQKGYRVAVSQEGREGLAMALSLAPDLILLDVMLPGMNGYDLCTELRKQVETPVIMVTARTDEGDKLIGFAAGVDDYVTKPFSLPELLARVRAVLHRTHGGARNGEGSGTAGTFEEPLVFPGLRIDPNGHVVERDGVRIGLTPKEFDLLWCLATRSGAVVKRSDLLREVWGNPEEDDRTLHTHINRLRAKLQEGEQRYIHTIWGIGYKFEATDKDERVLQAEG
jgi:two-component system response regulator ResD